MWKEFIDRSKKYLCKQCYYFYFSNPKERETKEKSMEMGTEGTVGSHAPKTKLKIWEEHLQTNSLCF